MSDLYIDLAALRVRAGVSLTVRKASEQAGVSRRTWQRWEAAGKIPLGALKRFCEATGLSFKDYL